MYLTLEGTKLIYGPWRRFQGTELIYGLRCAGAQRPYLKTPMLKVQVLVFRVLRYKHMCCLHHDTLSDDKLVNTSAAPFLEFHNLVNFL